MAGEEHNSVPAGPPDDLDAYLRTLCEHTGVAVVGMNEHLTIRFWNQAAARLFGAGADQMLGVSGLSVIPQAGRSAAERMFGKALQEGEIGGFEFCHRDSQGHRRQLAATVSPVVNDTGTIVGASACIRDITNRLILEERLAQNRKMASLGAMAGAMAHHINNILGGIVTSVDYALASHDPLMERRVLERTAVALGRASELGKGLLTFAEGDYRHADLADLTETVLEALDAIQTDLKDAHIDLDLNLEPIPVTPVPRLQFRTLLCNILRNAIEAMPQGGRLTVELEPVAQGYALRVKDTGVGIPEELRDRIFEPFFSTKSADGTGTGLGETQPGLGLAVAHGILQYLGGWIEVDSRVGEGTAFELLLPLHPRLPHRNP